MDKNKLESICKYLRYCILTSTTAAGSGHPTSSMSAVELLAMVMFGGYYHFDFANPANPENDRLIFSKGHASPLLYSLYHVAGKISYDELLTLRKLGSRLEGHPTPNFPYAEAATGSLGQGLSIGLGMALGQKLRKASSNTFVLLGDSELAEGQNWEAVQLASHYKLNNLVALLDVNRIGQRGQTIAGWNTDVYRATLDSFGWRTSVIKDGHDLYEIAEAFRSIAKNATENRPLAIIAKTVKGKGISFLENQDGWHGKALDAHQLQLAIEEMGDVDKEMRSQIPLPEHAAAVTPNDSGNREYPLDIGHMAAGAPYSPREAYGDALVQIGKTRDSVLALDAETSNSTFAEKFKFALPERFFEMFIAEQNMVSAALGLSKMGFIPFVSTFSAFLTRAFDQIRMAQYSAADLKLTGSHCGVSIGSDGASQMGLEDIAMMRSIRSSIVFYPSDAVSAFKLTHIAADTPGIVYIRTTREKLPVIYGPEDKFGVGFCKVHRVKTRPQSPENKIDKIFALIIAAGITLHEALKTQRELAEKDVNTVVIDCYSVKPLPEKDILEWAQKAEKTIVVEDHYEAGGLGEAVATLLASNNQQLATSNSFHHLCVRKAPRSGTPDELLAYEEIDSAAITKAVKG